ncbi:response regulator transcription factor [Streptoalloteichus hindustanus]|uniref:response regulator transcription factor n=1 Tax=Streptoalloteichus hindustanus TaxID=2017 RepID=UPI0009362AC2|nr:response regulator transcription factor [Streptoalloteichus hindustanus]
MRIVVAEDSVLLREGLVRILEFHGHEVVGQVGTAVELLAAARELTPDLVITDVRMPPGNSDEGLRAALELRAEHADLPVLVLSQYVEQTYAAELLSSDSASVGYLLKDRVGDIEVLAAAVRQVALGGTVIDPQVVRQLLARNRERPTLARLTARERQVLDLMAQGQSNAAIAANLSVSEAAVAKHIGNVFDKLDLAVAPDIHRRVLAVLTYLRETS